MHKTFSHQTTFTSPSQTAQFAYDLSKSLKAGDTILLEGDIGAGKTHFARSLIQARLKRADRLEDIPSPTFTLVQTYDDDICEIWHADIYRLTHPDEVEELGLTQAFDEAICLVEWPDRLGDLSPKGALHMIFQASEEADAREITITGQTALWQDRIIKALSN